MHTRFTYRTALSAAVACAACAWLALPLAAGQSTQAGAASVDARIARIERGLLGETIAKGEAGMALADRMAFYQTPGVSVAVIHDGRIEWARGYGVVQAGTSTAVTPQTLFQAASISKSVAAFAAMRLVEQGVLRLDLDVNSRLVSWKIPDNAYTQNRPVTLRDLLNHSAGLTVHGFPGYLADAPVPTLLQVLDGAKPANTAPIRVDVRPGTMWRYSGGGFTVLQQLLIDVAGKPFPALASELALGPLGMRDSTCEQPLPARLGGVAASGHRANGQLLPGRYHTYPEMAAAGLWTTPGDLARFAVEMLRGLKGESRLLTQATAREMVTPVLGAYGLGLQLRGAGPAAGFAHGGANEGFRCLLVAYPQTGQGAVVMTNADRGNALAQELLRAIAREYGWSDFRPVEKGAADGLAHAAHAAHVIVPAGPDFSRTPSVTMPALHATVDPATDEAPSGERRRPGLALAEVIGVNVLYGLVNQVLPSDDHEHYHVSPRTWWANLRDGFTWDNDPFVINQLGHPYQGGNYFSAGRALGLRYWESLPLAAFGSFTWEFFGERTPPAWNDVVNTTLGGAAIGEVLHRIAWLVRDPQQTGAARRVRELAALGVDPVGGLNRFASGAASRVGPRAPGFEPRTLAGDIALGVVWRQTPGSPAFARAAPYGTFRLDYGGIEEGPAREPFDAFTLALRVGGGSGIADASIRGRLAARSLGGGPRASHQIVLVQGYDYQDNPALLSGGQTILGGLADRFTVSPNTTVTTTALAGVIVLGAIDSLSEDVNVDRPFDYGSGLLVSASAAVTCRGHRLLQLSLSRTALHTITRATANHVLARYSAVGRLPIARGLHVVVEGEHVARTSTARAVPGRVRNYSELRAGLSWAFGR
jgi:CubicO group peptidase (beta-lactamase class C family)